MGRRIHDNVKLVVLALVVVTLASGWVTYTAYAASGTHTEKRTTGSWTTETAYAYGATVTRPNALYPVGTRLSNRSLYFGKVAPVLDGSFRFGYRGESGNLTVHTDPTLVVRSAKRGRNGAVSDVYWSKSRALGSARNRTIRPGKTVSVPFSVNVSRVANATSRIRDQIGKGPGSVEALVRVNVTYRGTVDGHHVSGSSMYPLRIDPGATYTVKGNTTTNARHTFTRRVTVVNEPGPPRTVGGPVFLALGLIGVLVVGAGERTGRFELSDAERAYDEYRSDREEYDEWIHTVSLPETADALPVAEAATLRDLVDVAIDTDNAVLESPADGSYHVVHDGYHYKYDPPARPSDTGAAYRQAEQAGNGDGGPADSDDDGT